MSSPTDISSANHERLVSQLEEALHLAPGARKPTLQLVQHHTPAAVIALAKSIFRARRRRESQLCELGFEFGEPVWDLVLDLFVSAHEGRQISVSSACLAANVPPTTALRWITTLTERGLIVRESDPSDKRRNNLRLSVTALDAMERYLSAELAGRDAGRS